MLKKYNFIFNADNRCFTYEFNFVILQYQIQLAYEYKIKGGAV